MPPRRRRRQPDDGDADADGRGSRGRGDESRDAEGRSADDLAARVRAARRAVGGSLAELQAAAGLLQALDDDLRQRPAEAAEDSERRIDEVCQRLLDHVRKRCPGLLRDEPLRNGETAPAVPLVGDHVTVAVAAAARTALVGPVGVVGTRRKELPRAALWREGADELLVLVADIAVRTDEGLVLVTVPVACDELQGRADVVVPFVVGTAERPTGLLAATATRPRGPDVVVERWAEALTTLAWQAVLDAVAGVAGAAGRDEDGAPLIPAAVVATREGLVVLPQARHAFDRLGPPRATRPALTAGAEP